MGVPALLAMGAAVAYGASRRVRHPSPAPSTPALRLADSGTRRSTLRTRASSGEERRALQPAYHREHGIHTEARSPLSRTKAASVTLDAAEVEAITGLGRADGRLFDADPVVHEES